MTVTTETKEFLQNKKNLDSQYRKILFFCKKHFPRYYAQNPITIIMAYFKKVDNLTGKPKKEKRASFSSFPKAESSDDTKPKKKKPFGKGGAFYEKKKKKPLGEDELIASRGFYKSKTGYNSPSAPWNKEKSVRKPEERKSYGEESRGAGGQSPAQTGRPKTFEKK